VGALLAALIMGTFVTLEGGNIAREMGIVEDEDVVLVFVVPLPENEERSRGGVAPGRIVWAGEAGMALVGGRVVTPSLDAAGKPVAALAVHAPVVRLSLEAGLAHLPALHTTAEKLARALGRDAEHGSAAA